jgi:hypothetical protein
MLDAIDVGLFKVFAKRERERERGRGGEAINLNWNFK